MQSSAMKHLCSSLALGLFAVAASAACTRDDGKRGQLKVAISAITACPAGATLEGEAPPAGLRQRCQKGEVTRHGASREWYEDGRERAYSEWWEGEKHGRFSQWFENGKLKAEGAHRFGQPAGQWKLYGEDGVLRQERTFAVAAPAVDWVAQALAGLPPVRDIAPAAVPEDVAAGAQGAEVAAAPAATVPTVVRAPAPGTVKQDPAAGQTAPVPAADPVFARGASAR